MSQEIDTHKGIIAWFARNHVAANLLMWILLFGGVFGIFTIHKQVFPNPTDPLKAPYKGTILGQILVRVLIIILTSRY
ncbi:MAG: hypothetical protein ACPH3C_07735, partial [Glaciecola sp.]